MSIGDDETNNGELGAPEYLVYRVLFEMDRKDNRETSRTRIHKLCCLVDRYLQEEYNRDVGLPKHWYMYGPTIDEALINRTIIFQGKANHFSGEAYYPADQVSESDFDHLSEDLKDDIFNAVIATIKEHGDKSAEELREYQYNNFAPNEFVRAFGDLRWYLQLSSESEPNEDLSHFLDTGQKTRIERKLDEMLVAFDKENNSDIYGLYLDWDDTFRMMNELGRSPRELLDFLEMFVEAVAKLTLRFQDHSHITEERLKEWEIENEEIKTDLQNKIKRKRKEALNQRDYQNTLDTVSESYNETIFDELEDL